MSFSGTRGEGFGKLHIKVLLTQGYSGAKCALVCLVPQYVLCIGGGESPPPMHKTYFRDQWIKNICKHDKDDSLFKKRS